MVSLAVVVVVGSAEEAEAVPAALAVDAVEEVLLVCPVRSSCSIKAREEEERAEMDMRGSFQGGRDSVCRECPAGARKTLVDSLRVPNPGHSCDVGSVV